MNEPTLSAGGRAFVGLQYWLPQHLLSRGMHALTRSRIGWFKNGFIRVFLNLYKQVNLSEAVEPDATRYESFNAFFTRALKPDARPIVAAPAAIASPVDGTVSQCGPLAHDLLLQAKGIQYSTGALLADEALAREFDGGTFATIYLAPYNYHRIHMPQAGTLRRAIYVPGDLFSVNTVTAATVPHLFSRNERIVCVFDTEAGPCAVVLVGALFVGSMSLVWAGEVTADRPKTVRELPVPSPAPRLARGEELGRFNMGSTVIVVWPRGRAALDPALAAGREVRMGESIGELLG